MNSTHDRLAHRPRAAAASSLAALVLLACMSGASPSSAYPLSRAPDCPVFPADNHWNLKVDDLAVKPNSEAIIESIGTTEGVHADFGSGLWQGAPIGIPVNVVGKGQSKVPVSFRYADESDPGPYPIPPDAEIEGGSDSDGDRHVIVVDKKRCKLFELFDAHPKNDGARWEAGSGAIWDLESNRLRPRGWTSADAAGLPILPGLVRYDEIREGKIDHALRFTVADTRRAFIYPARHYASDSDDPDLPAMGERLRLEADFEISGYPRQARIVLKALKRYGMIVADNGSDLFITGEPNRHWNNDALHALGSVTGADFEVVDTSVLPRP